MTSLGVWGFEPWWALPLWVVTGPCIWIAYGAFLWRWARQ